MADADLVWENSTADWLADKPNEHSVYLSQMIQLFQQLASGAQCKAKPCAKLNACCSKKNATLACRGVKQFQIGLIFLF